MSEPVQNVLSGFNSTVFIYGMTGAGKTHTMFNAASNNSQNSGLVTLTLNNLFDIMKSCKANRYEVFLSFFEIYNENIRDLLS